MGKEGAVGERARALRTGKNYSRELYFHSHSIFLHLQSEFPAWELSPNCILWWDSAGLNLSATWRVWAREKSICWRSWGVLGRTASPKLRRQHSESAQTPKSWRQKEELAGGLSPASSFPSSPLPWVPDRHGALKALPRVSCSASQ